MHTLIRFVALYASIMTIVSALFFVAYLEIYSLVTGGVELNFGDWGWHVKVPKIAMWTFAVSGFAGACGALAQFAGF